MLSQTIIKIKNINKCKTLDARSTFPPYEWLNYGSYSDVSPSSINSFISSSDFDFITEGTLPQADIF